MKKFTVFITFICFLTVTLSAQDTYSGPNYTGLEKQLAKSNNGMVDPKSNIKPKFWIDRGEIFQDINDVNIQFLAKGSTTPQFAQLYFKLPKGTKKDSIGRDVYMFERIDLVFENNLLVDWDETQPIAKDPLDSAWTAFSKAKELNIDGKATKSLKKHYERLRQQLVEKGIRVFDNKDYNTAMRYWGYSLDLDTMKFMETKNADTIIIYYCGLAAFNAGKYDIAINRFNKASELNCTISNLYPLISETYMKLGDSASAIKALEDGGQRYPENIEIINYTINFYLIKNDAPKAIEYLSKAKQKDPKNYSYYYAEGVMYENLSDTASAAKAYKKALELKPDYFNAYYNMGIMHYNSYIRIMKAAADIPLNENARYQKEVEKAKVEIIIALPYLEEALKLDPKTNVGIGEYKNTLISLKEIYTRLQNTAKADEMKSLLDAIQ